MTSKQNVGPRSICEGIHKFMTKTSKIYYKTIKSVLLLFIILPFWTLQMSELSDYSLLLKESWVVKYNKWPWINSKTKGFGLGLWISIHQLTTSLNKYSFKKTKYLNTWRKYKGLKYSNKHFFSPKHCGFWIRYEKPPM